MMRISRSLSTISPSEESESLKCRMDILRTRTPPESVICDTFCSLVSHLPGARKKDGCDLRPRVRSPTEPELVTQVNEGEWRYVRRGANGWWNRVGRGCNARRRRRLSASAESGPATRSQRQEQGHDQDRSHQQEGTREPVSSTFRNELPDHRPEGNHRPGPGPSGVAEAHNYRDELFFEKMGDLQDLRRGPETETREHRGA